MNKSLTLYASILLLSPLSSAMGFSDMSFYGSIGSVGATFGECDETAGTIGGKTAGGKVRCMSYSRATFSVGAQTTVRDMFTIEGGFTVVDSEKDRISNFAYEVGGGVDDKHFAIDVEPKNRAFLAVGYRFYDAITVGLKTTFLADEFILEGFEAGQQVAILKSDETEIFPGISFSVDTTYRGFGVGISGAFSMKDVEKTKDKGTAANAPQNIFSTDTPSTLVEGAIKISYQRSQDA